MPLLVYPPSLSRPLSLSRTLVSIRLAAGCSIFDANAKPSEKVNANAKLDTRRARRRRNFEEQQIVGAVRRMMANRSKGRKNWKNDFSRRGKERKIGFEKLYYSSDSNIALRYFDCTEDNFSLRNSFCLTCCVS